MTSAILDPASIRKIMWRVAPVPVFMYFLCIIDRVNLGYASIPMMHDLGLTSAQYGLAAGLLYLTYVIFEVPSTIALEKTSPRLWFSRIMVTWGLCSAACGIVQNSTQLYIARLALGMAEAGLYPGVIFYLTLWLPKTQRIAVVALFTTASPVALLIGAPISGFLVDHASFLGHTGWRAMLIMEGLAPAIFGLIIPFILPNKPEDVTWLDAREKLAINRALARESAGTEARHSSLAALKNKSVWILGCVFFGINTTFAILFFFLPQIVAGFRGAKGVTGFQVGIIAAAPFAFATVSVIAFGFWLRGKETRTAQIAVPLAMAALGTALPAMTSNQVLAIGGLCVAASGAYCALASFWQLPPAVLPKEGMASGIAMTAAIGVSSAGILPLVNGYIKDLTGSLDYAMLVNALIIILSLVACLIVGSRITREVRASRLIKQL